MRVLFLCNKSPWPTSEGGPLAMNANIQALLKAGHEVKVLAMNTNKYFVDIEEVPETYKQQTSLELIYTDLSIKPWAAFLNLFSKESFHVSRFKTSAFTQKVTEVLQAETFDVVQLEMLYMTPYIETIREYSDAAIVLRSHNIEHLIWKRVAETTTNPLKALYLKYLTRKLKNYELGHLNSYDGIATISQNDGDFFRSQGCNIPLVTVPFGVEVSEYKPGNGPVDLHTLFHIGSMNWMPNEEGIRWFVAHVVPLINQKFPQLKLYLAGREMPEWLNESHFHNVEVLGEVPDARDFIHSKGIMIVPLFSGSGIRIKIIEGMALGKAIISTSIGAEGIHYTDGENISIANTPGEFITAIEMLMDNQQKIKSLGKAARKLIAEEHSLENVSRKLESFYHEILKK